MRIALTGSTTEPVISHSTMKRHRDQQPDREREVRGDGVLLVDELRGGAADQPRRGLGSPSGCPARAPRAVSPSGLPAARTSTCQVVAVELARLGHGAHAWAARRASWRSAGGLRHGRPRGEHDGDRAGVLTAEVARERVGDGARALPLGDHRGIHRGPGGAQRGERDRPASARRSRPPPAAGGASRRERGGTTSPARRGARRAAGAGRRAWRPIARTSVGVITSEAAPATRATTAPAMPIDFRKPSGKTVSVIRAVATVTALKATVRPAVLTVVRMAPAPGSLAWPVPRGSA